MSEQEASPDVPKPIRRWFQFSLRTLLLATTLFAALCSLFAWQCKRAERQKRCIGAIRQRGGHVYYDYQVTSDGVNWGASSHVPSFLLDRLGEDFFHGVAGVDMAILLPAQWDEDREQAAFDEGCLVPGSVFPNSWDRYGTRGYRKLVYPSATSQPSASDWARSALRQYLFGCDKVTLHADYCASALKMDPNNIAANLLLGEPTGAGTKEERQSHLRIVLRFSGPDSLEYAHAQKLLSGKAWTFTELCKRIGPDGSLR